MRRIQLVYSNPVPGMEDEFNECGNFYEAIGEKVVRR